VLVLAGGVEIAGGPDAPLLPLEPPTACGEPKPYDTFVVPPAVEIVTAAGSTPSADAIRRTSASVTS